MDLNNLIPDDSKVLQTAVTFIEELREKGLARVTSRGTVVFEMESGTAYSRYYQLMEHIRIKRPEAYKLLKTFIQENWA